MGIPWNEGAMCAGCQNAARCRGLGPQEGFVQGVAAITLIYASECPYPGTQLAGLFFIPDSYDLTAFLCLVAAHQERAVPWAGATSTAGSKGPPACAEGQNGLKPKSLGDLCQTYLASACCVASWCCSTSLCWGLCQ